MNEIGKPERSKCSKPNCAFCQRLLHGVLGLVKEENNLSSFIKFVNKIQEQNGNQR